MIVKYYYDKNDGEVEELTGGIASMLLLWRAV